jgi:hypothetical protein
MSLKKIFKAASNPDEFIATYHLYRELGAGWYESLFNAVECLCRYQIKAA